jgi:DNA-binding CsgD family transcriptional regulator
MDLLAEPVPSHRVGPSAFVEPRLLVALRALIPSDIVVFNDLAPWRESAWVESVSGDPNDPDFQTPQQDAEFFEYFWSAPCSQPDRSGDWVSATTLTDFYMLREVRRLQRHVGEEFTFERELLLPLPSAHGHSRRVRFVRSTGRDYDDTDRTLAALIRPHLAAYLNELDISGRGIVPLTERQQQLMALLADGRTNSQAARTLGISSQTVRTHLEHIYTKLGVNSRGEALALLYPLSEVSAAIRVRRGEEDLAPSRAG